MSAAIPFPLFPVRGRTPIYVALGLIFVVWPPMMLASNNKVPGTDAGARLILAACAWLIAAIGALQVRGLARARDAIGKQVLPQVLWRRWMRACVAETSLIWAFLAIVSGTLLASTAPALPWAFAPALLSLCVCAGTVSMMTFKSMMPARFQLPAKAIVGALLVAGMWLVSPLMAWIASLPLAALAALSMAWPLLGGVLMLRAGRLMKRHPQPSAPQRGTLLASIDSRLRRYTPLDWRNGWNWRTAPQQAGYGTRLGWLLNATMPVLIFSNLLTPVDFLRGPEVGQLVALGLLTLMMTQALVARDLHWRLLLLPGGWRRGKIASGIFFSTMKIQLLVMVATGLGYVLVQRFKGEPVWDALATVARHTPLMWEVGFAVSAALVLRALQRSVLVRGAIATAIGGAWIHLTWFGGRGELPWSGAGMLIMQIAMPAATVVLLYVANRMWTTEKLLACARHGA